MGEGTVDGVAECVSKSLAKIHSGAFHQGQAYRVVSCARRGQLHPFQAKLCLISPLRGRSSCSKRRYLKRKRGQDGRTRRASPKSRTHDGVGNEKSSGSSAGESTTSTEEKSCTDRWKNKTCQLRHGQPAATSVEARAINSLPPRAI